MSDNQPLDPTATSIFGLAPVTEDVDERWSVAQGRHLPG